jgi:hypothetical protein
MNGTFEIEYRNKKQFMRIQKKLFELGFKWKGPSSKIRTT